MIRLYNWILIMSDIGFFSPSGLSADLLLGSYQAASDLRLARLISSGRAANAPQINTAKPDTSVPPPWDAAAKPLGQEEILNKALASGQFFYQNLESFSNTSAPEDQKKLFALYQGIRRLSALGVEAADKTVTDSRRRLLDRRLGEGITQLESFLGTTEFEELSFLKGAKSSKADSTLSIERNRSDYVTGVIYDGTFDDAVPAFAGNAQFTITAKRVTGDIVVNIDLAEMGATVRNLDNVADYINGKLDAAGLYSTFKRVKIGEPDENNIVPGNQFGYKILGTGTEPLQFTPVTGTPAIYVAGTSGIGDTQTARISKFDAEALSAPAIDFSTRLEAAEDASTKFLATKTGSNGEIYAIVSSDGEVAGLQPRGEKDIYLVRYDSSGKTIFTRGLGSAGDIDVSDLEIGSDGSVIISGKVSGTLGDTTKFGGSDSFVAKFDANGNEQFIKRFGVFADDQANAVTVDNSGNIFVVGSTSAALTGSHNGGKDAYIRAMDSNGNTLFTRQFGTAANETAKEIAIDANGNLLVASEENGIGKLTKFNSNNGTDPAIWQVDLGALDSGSISSLRVDGTAIIVGGSVGAANGLGAGILAHSGERDGFLTRIDEDGGGNPARTWTSFLGTSATDTISEIASANGKLYVAGTTGGSMPGGGVLDGSNNAFVSRIDLATGAVEGTSQITGGGGNASAAAISIDSTGTSVLDAFRLPKGMAVTVDSSVLTTRSVARDGDSFQISLNGGLKRTIRIDSDDTYRALTFKINAVLLLDGKAEISRGAKGDTLRIKPGPGNSIELFAGPEGRDLLSALGIPEGAVQLEAENDADETSSSAPPVYALGFSSDIALSTLKQANAANEALNEALTLVRSAYRTLTLDPALKALLEGGNKANGPVPAYLSAQIANYSAGLARLTGG
ncbi:MAG: SBBP repeat-containing protein [Robiginitomaculum sp.]|nr:SBBP repeat-containing protein [Robiginitomaculum sp.]